MGYLSGKWGEKAWGLRHTWSCKDLQEITWLIKWYSQWVLITWQPPLSPMLFLTFSALGQSSQHGLGKETFTFCSQKLIINPMFPFPTLTISKTRWVLKQIHFYSLQIFASHKICQKSCPKRQREGRVKAETGLPLEQFTEQLKVTKRGTNELQNIQKEH